MSEFDICIERTVSGYELRLRDPEIVKANKKTDKPPTYSYKDPYREFVLKDKAALLKFLEDNIEKALPKDDFESSFDTAVAAANGEAGAD